MKKKDLRQIMLDAWRFFRSAGVSFSECLKVAWANYKLKKSLRKGIVHFEFRKKDGSLRRAVGTLKETFLPSLKGSGVRRSDEVITYFDLEKNGFRAFRKELLMF